MKIINKILIIVSLMGALSPVSHAITSLLPSLMGKGPITGVVPLAPGEVRPYLRVENHNKFGIWVVFNSYIDGSCSPFSANMLVPGTRDINSVPPYEYINSNFLLTKPERLCVYVRGITSTTGVGGWTPVYNNTNCVIKISDNGFMKGIKAEYTDGCKNPPVTK